ncbi:MAG: DUF1015 domain-containing protein [Treponema sp.]|jgi:hypothetical protein|nr:DUF1015 domain-containing protein [Treponema sp.]
MGVLRERFAALGAAIPEILLPREGIDLQKWALIACDQYTQDRSFWENAERLVGDAPSTLRFIFPEAYLEDRRQERINSIQRAMASALENDLVPHTGCVYVERDTPYNRNRRGLILALDLECYRWEDDSRTLIRPTEGTVPERITARMETRRGAPLETPHILVLIDDRENKLLPALGERARQRDPCYDSPLLFNAGRVRGWLLDREDDLEFLAGGLETLAAHSPFLYAMGDGNHSLAAAGAVWNEYKRARADEDGIENHPARWALVEVENLHDPALSFQPIHRVLFNTSLDEVYEALRALPGFRSRPSPDDAPVSYRLVSRGRERVVETDAGGLAVEPLQNALDDFLKSHPAATIDYIHGAEEVARIAAVGAVGILLPPFPRENLFQTVAGGPLPRKSFSLGESSEKRFYLECRRINL